MSHTNDWPLKQRMPLHTNQIPSQILNCQVLRNVRVCVFFLTSSGVSAGLLSYRAQKRHFLFLLFLFWKDQWTCPHSHCFFPFTGLRSFAVTRSGSPHFLPEWNLVSQEFKCFMQQFVVENVANHISVLYELFPSSQPFKKCFKVLCKSLDLYFLFLGIFVF